MPVLPGPSQRTRYTTTIIDIGATEKPNTLLPTHLAEVINFYANTVKGVANTLEKTETDELTSA